MIYTVTFNPAVDYIVRTKALTAGAVNRSESEEIYFGGKGLNVSLGLSELGGQEEPGQCQTSVFLPASANPFHSCSALQ